jgi:hypothetical protein
MDKHQILLNAFMKMVNPEFRHNWEFTKYYFDNTFKYPITRKEWKRWMEKNNETV